MLVVVDDTVVEAGVLPAVELGVAGATVVDAAGWETDAGVVVLPPPSPVHAANSRATTTPATGTGRREASPNHRCTALANLSVPPIRAAVARFTARVSRVHSERAGRLSCPGWHGPGSRTPACSPCTPAHRSGNPWWVDSDTGAEASVPPLPLIGPPPPPFGCPARIGVAGSEAAPDRAKMLVPTHPVLLGLNLHGVFNFPQSRRTHGQAVAAAGAR